MDDYHYVWRSCNAAWATHHLGLWCQGQKKGGGGVEIPPWHAGILQLLGQSLARTVPLCSLPGVLYDIHVAVFQRLAASPGARTGAANGELKYRHAKQVAEGFHKSCGGAGN